MSNVFVLETRWLHSSKLCSKFLGVQEEKFDIDVIGGFGVSEDSNEMFDTSNQNSWRIVLKRGIDLPDDNINVSCFVPFDIVK